MAHAGGDIRKDIVPNNILLNLSRKITGEWKNIARCLALPEGAISHISADYSNNIQEQIYQMLVSWKRKEGQNATYGVLFQALQLASRNDLVHELCPTNEDAANISGETRQEASNRLSKEEAFRSTLVDIARMLRKSDVQSLVFQCPQIPPSDQDSIQDGVRLFDAMQRYGILTVERLDDLLGKLNLVEPLRLLTEFRRLYDSSK